MTHGPLFFDDLTVGMAWQTAERAISAELVAAFAELSGDRTPVHLDAAAARAAGYPGVVAHGLLVAAVATGLLSQATPLAPGVLATRRLEWEFSRPVVAGTAIRCLARLASTRPAGPATGLADLEVEVVDAAGVRLQRGRLRLLLRRRPPQPD